MNFDAICKIEPELRRLADSATNAGQYGAASWTATSLAIHERLSKLAGHGGHDERLRSDECYETARAAIHAAWAATSPTFAHVAFLAPHGNQRPTFARWPTQANVVYTSETPPVVGTFRKSGQGDGGGNRARLRQSLFCLSAFFQGAKNP